MPDDPRARFGPVAVNYSRSTFHTSADRLQEVIDLAKPLKGDLALDVATGTGNTALALAPHVRRVVGLDLTREMLDGARRAAQGGAAPRSLARTFVDVGGMGRAPGGGRLRGRDVTRAGARLGLRRVDADHGGAARACGRAGGGHRVGRGSGA